MPRSSLALTTSLTSLYSKRAFVHWYVGEGEAAQQVPDLLSTQTDDWDLSNNTPLTSSTLSKIQDCNILVSGTPSGTLTFTVPLVSTRVGDRLRRPLGAGQIRTPSTVTVVICPCHRPRVEGAFNPYGKEGPTACVKSIDDCAVGVGLPPGLELAATHCNRNSMRRRRLRRV